jgi:tRNA 2-thiouridine synthesizing protein C
MKKVLAIVSRPPYAGAQVVETLEAAMVTRAFDLPTAVLFRGLGVTAFQENQAPENLGRKSVAKVIAALPTYEVEDLYVCRDSLAKYQLESQHFSVPVTVLSGSEIASLIGEHDVVMAG